MDAWFDTVTLSRLQFAVTTMFHIVWPVLSIGLSAWLVFLEAAWLKTGREVYYHQARYWMRLFLLSFAMGVASGVPLEFQFGTNWARFSQASGGFFGNVLGFEAAMAFMLEAAFVGIMVFGARRVSRRVHMLATCIVAFGASLSAFWIMAANSWMQTPAGIRMEGGQVRLVDYYAALFSPSWLPSFAHMEVACLEASLFVVAGLSAWYVLRNRQREFFLTSFRLSVAAVVVLAPLQVWLGDVSGRDVVKHQPAKAAAMEAHWRTNPPGTSAGWAVVAWPDPNRQDNAWELRVPCGLSLLATHRLDGQVKGLREFPPADQPPVAVTFYAFRIMLAAGTLMLLLAAWAAWQAWRGRLRIESLAGRWFWRAWAWAIPLGFVAVESGWVLREVGRQPWIVYGLLRTADGASELPAGAVAGTLAGYCAIYLVLTAVFLLAASRLIGSGADLSQRPPGQEA